MKNKKFVFIKNFNKNCENLKRALYSFGFSVSQKGTTLSAEQRNNIHITNSGEDSEVKFKVVPKAPNIRMTFECVSEDTWSVTVSFTNKDPQKFFNFSTKTAIEIIENYNDLSPEEIKLIREKKLFYPKEKEAEAVKKEEHKNA